MVPKGENGARCKLFYPLLACVHLLPWLSFCAVVFPWGQHSLLTSPYWSERSVCTGRHIGHYSIVDIYVNFHCWVGVVAINHKLRLLHHIDRKGMIELFILHQLVGSGRILPWFHTFYCTCISFNPVLVLQIWKSIFAFAGLFDMMDKNQYLKLNI